MIRILQGDCRAVMATLPESSIDAIVTDPPYELGFMGKGWDRTGVANDVETWRQALRVLKPGGHLLAFSGTRTYHRMVCAIEDAGFEVRDQIGWVYGSGFPKSLDVSKAIDKAAGAERETGPIDPKRAARLVNQQGDYETESGWSAGGRRITIDTPATDAARQWAGWGTALKPAFEPVVVARKPLIGTVAANVQAHGTGALNIDGCRVGTEVIACPGHAKGDSYTRDAGPDRSGSHKWNGDAPSTHVGRWPANIIHDGSDEVLAAFPASIARPAKAILAGGTSGSGKKDASAVYGAGREFLAKVGYDDEETSAARFFYTAKASGEDRNEGLGRARNTHPTVKPTDLMRYLCRLVTPPGGVVLDPFMGSGSTLKAAELEGFEAVGIELQAEYIEIAKRRIGSDAPLFAEVETA